MNVAFALGWKIAEPPVGVNRAAEFDGLRQKRHEALGIRTGATLTDNLNRTRCFSHELQILTFLSCQGHDISTLP